MTQCGQYIKWVYLFSIYFFQCKFYEMKGKDSSSRFYFFGLHMISGKIYPFGCVYQLMTWGSEFDPAGMLYCCYLILYVFHQQNPWYFFWLRFLPWGSIVIHLAYNLAFIWNYFTYVDLLILWSAGDKFWFLCLMPWEMWHIFQFWFWFLLEIYMCSHPYYPL